jgi:hypothetical protein
MKFTIQLRNAAEAHGALVALWAQIKPLLLQGKLLIVTVKTDSRSLAQNRIMWSVLEDLSQQVPWFGKRLTADGWKDFITAHLNGQELVPNMDGTGFVALGKGKSTSDMTIAEMTAVIDLGHAFGDDKGVQWRPTSLGRDWPDGATSRKAKQAVAA